MRRIIGALMIMIIGSACSPAAPAEIDWTNYAPEVRERVTRLADQGDCYGLQDEFDIAERNGSIDLMRAINDRMIEIGCGV